MNKHKARVVLFLGAGFSKGIASSFPLTSNLYARLTDEVLRRKSKYLSAVHEVEAAVTSKNSGPIEQLFEEILREVWSNYQSRYARVEAQELYRILVNGVALVTRYSHQGYSRYADKRSSLGKYLHALRELSSFCDLKVITTNYDLINDKVVQFLNDERLGLPQNIHPPKNLLRFQYGFNIRAVWTSDSRGTSIHDNAYAGPWAEHDRLIQIYKIHGSSNWAYCRTCNAMDLSRIFSDVRKIYSFRSHPSCPRCLNKYEYLIIPPLPDKSALTNGFLELVWRKAARALKEANYVVFIGYSMPSADPRVVKMIKDSIGPRKKYFVMDTNPTILDKYEALFGKPVLTFNDGYRHHHFREVVTFIKRAELGL